MPFKKHFVRGGKTCKTIGQTVLRAKRFLLEVGKLDEQDFNDEILAIHLILEFLKADLIACCVSVGALFFKR